MKRNRSNFLRWRHDIQHNDTQLNSTAYNDAQEWPKVRQTEGHSFTVLLNVIVLSVVILSAVFLSFVFSECHYSECRYSQCLYSQCHYSECHYSQCLGAFYDGIINFQKEFLFCFLRAATKTYLRAVYISEICRIFLYSENAKH
jgi:hypothetical protein